MDKNFKHYKIFSQHPWINPDKNCTPPYLVIGDDLDSLLSATIWNHVSCRDWKIIGVYHKYSQIYAATPYFQDLPNAIWLDLDINSYWIRSLGHHLILSKKSQILPNNHINLNYLRGITTQNFQRKYPLGTIHFLLYLFDVGIPEREFATEMIMSADSTWINGQSHKFASNVKDWIENCIPRPLFKKYQKVMDSYKVEERMQKYFEFLKSKKIPQGTGQVESRHLQLKGYQFQFDPSNQNSLKNRLDVIESITGWSPPKICTFDKKVIGTRQTKKLKDWPDFNLNKIMENDKIFSYVFPHKGTINYTKNMEFKS